jgi:dynein heavy chain 2
MKTNILISSIVDSPVDTLFHLIHNVYSPVLQIHQSQNSRGQDAYDAKLTDNLADLESNLKIAIRRSEDGNSNKRSTLSPLDEFQYWADMSERGKNKDAKERAAFFYSEFEPLVKFYKKIDNCHVQEIMEIIEATQDSYDYVWQQVDYEPTYSQERMINLLEITGNSVFMPF